MREKAIKNTIICAYKNLKSKAYKKIVMALMIFMAVIQVGIISNNKIKAAQTENNQYEINIALVAPARHEGMACEGGFLLLAQVGPTAFPPQLMPHVD